jgi:PAS domain S-box-containing protein
MDLDDLSQNVEGLLGELATAEVQRARYQAMFELAPDAAIVTDCAGVILEANLAAGELLGVAPGLLAGAPLADLMLPTNPLSGAADESNLRWEGQLQPADGVPFHAMARAARVPDEHGRPAYWRWSLRRASPTAATSTAPAGSGDEWYLRQTVVQLEAKVAGRTADLRQAGERLLHELGERQQAEAQLRASEELFRSIYENSAIGIELYDQEGRLQDVNPACLALFGVIDPAQIRDFKLFEDPNIPLEMRECLLQGEGVRYEAPFDFEKVKAAGLYETTRSGVWRMEVIITPVNVPRAGFLVQVYDVTERARTTELSQALNTINAVINSTLDVEQALAQVAAEAMATLGAQSAVVALTDGDGWRVQGVVGLPNEMVNDHFGHEEAPYSNLAVQSGTPIVTSNLSSSSPGIRALASAFGVQGCLIVPLTPREEVIGALIFNYQVLPLTLNDMDLDFARKLSATVSMALDNARLYQQTRYEQARWLATVESMLDPVTVSDAAGHAIYMNPAYSELIGRHIQPNLTLEEHPRYYALFRPDGTPFPVEELPLQRAVLRNEAVRNVELVQVSTNGDSVHAIYNAAPLHDEAGQVIGAVAVGHDVTEQRRVEAERERLLERLANEKARLDAVLQQMPAGVAMSEAPTGRLILGNEQMARIWRKPVLLGSDLAKHGYYRGFHPDGRPYTSGEWPMARAIFDGEVVQEEEIEIERGDGSHGIIRVNASPIRGVTGQIIAAVSTFFDVTEYVEMQAALRRARDELESRVQERTVELNHANQELRRQAEALGRYARRLQLLSAIDQAALSARSTQEIATVGVNHLRHALPCHHAGLFAYDLAAGEAVVLAAAAANGTRLEPGMRLPLADLGGVGGRPSQIISMVDDLQMLADPTPLHRQLLAEGARSFIQAPLFSTQQLEAMGSLTLTAAEPGAFTQETMDTAREVANSLAVAIENDRLNEQARQSRQQLQNLFRRLMAAQENERRYVADQLHNNADQQLAALKLGLRLLEQAPDCSERVEQGLSEMREATGQILLDLHDLGVELWPSSLEHLGVVPAMGQFIESFKRRSGLNVQLSTNGWKERRLPREIEVTLYRVLQEALNNVLRHAQASHVQVILDRLGDRVIGIVEDDGVGFEPAVALGQSRLGLFGMKERVAMAGGELIIESAPGAGATLLVELPIA